MRIKSYKDLVGLSIAQARAAYDTTINKYGVLVQTIVDVSAQRDAAQAEVERLTKVIASYDTPAELEAAKNFIKAFNIDVKKYEADVARGRQILDEDMAAVAESEVNYALRSKKQSLKEGMDNMPSVTEDQALAQARRVMGEEESVEKPSKDSLQKVWAAIRGTKRGLPADQSKWTRRRLAQLNRLKELGYARVAQAGNGSWWGIEPGPKPDET